uniref:Uncharacterized protein n=1 Tax=Coccolithus braarudii TaxID=221442 RepID=A0A7S0LDI0_9EUKA
MLAVYILSFTCSFAPLGHAPASLSRKAVLVPRVQPLVAKDVDETVQPFNWAHQLVQVSDVAPAAYAIGRRLKSAEEAEIRPTFEAHKQTENLDHGLPRKHTRAHAQQLGERVSLARSTVDAAIEQRARELVNSAVDEWMNDMIDETELQRRKQEARQQATSEQVECGILLEAFDAYGEALKERDNAFLAFQQAEQKVDAFEMEVHAALALLEPALSGAVDSSVSLSSMNARELHEGGHTAKES